MGEHAVQKSNDLNKKINFTRRLLQDIEALELMLEQDLFEKAPIRIGAEQEFFLVNEEYSPSNQALEILETINDPHFTTELGLFNLEVNLDPQLLEGPAFRLMQNQLDEMLVKAHQAAAQFNNKVVLTGILPTLRSREINLDYMTPMPRYYALNEIMKAIRGADFSLRIDGLDELIMKNDSVMFEACNTSFQLHLQIPAQDFVAAYNWAQAISGPLLSIATNSPILLGKELWHETRIALFQQSIDTRNSSYALVEQQPRVSFGNAWLKESVTEIFKDDITRFQIVITSDIKENSLETIKNGGTPKLKALRVHNGTVYRWNRPCYGITNGKPHLRIENRYIPAGPTVQDEMANFALWVGLMVARPPEYDCMADKMDFKDAKHNFIGAAKNGPYAALIWEGRNWTPRKLFSERLLPLAYQGLRKVGIEETDIVHYLGIIEQRIQRQTGSQWQINNYRKLQKQRKYNDHLALLTQYILNHQSGPLPVSSWPDIEASQNLQNHVKYVYQIMTRDMFVVQENDLIDMVAAIMKWNNIHHLPVETKEGTLSGLLTWTNIIQLVPTNPEYPDYTVGQYMVKKVICATSDELISEVVHRMKEAEIGCLPVVKGDKLIGIITRTDVEEWM